jgi:hypothetical protein
MPIALFPYGHQTHKENAMREILERRLAVAILLFLALLIALPAFAQQGFVPAQPSSSVLEVPQAFLGCWTGFPIITQGFVGGNFMTASDRLCFNPQPDFDYRMPRDVVLTPDKTTIIASDPDWMQFENRGHLRTATGAVYLQRVFIHCRTLSPSQIFCQGQTIINQNGIDPGAAGATNVADFTWTETLDREN